MNTFLTSLLFSCSGIGASSYEFSSSGSQSENDKANVEIVDFTPHFFRISEGWFPIVSDAISPEIQIQLFSANSYQKCDIALTGSIDNANLTETMSIKELSIKESNCNNATDELIKDKLMFSFVITELTSTQRDTLIDSFQKSATSTFVSFQDRIYGGTCAFHSARDNPIFTENCYFLGYSYMSGEISNAPIRNTQNPDVIRILGLVSQNISKLP